MDDPQSVRAADAEPGAGTPIRVALVDRDRVFRELMFSALDLESGIACVGSAANAEALRVVVAPDVILIHSSSVGAPEASECLARFSGAKLLAIRVDVRDIDVVSCIRYGVVGFVLSDASQGRIVRAIRAAHAGCKILPPPMKDLLFAQLTNQSLSDRRNVSPAEVPSLTTREWQILELVGDGLANKEIARRLRIEVATVKTHVHSLLGKLQMQGRSEIIRYRLGLGARASVERRAP